MSRVSIVLFSTSRKTLGLCVSILPRQQETLFNPHPNRITRTKRALSTRQTTSVAETLDQLNLHLTFDLHIHDQIVYTSEGYRLYRVLLLFLSVVYLLQIPMSKNIYCYRVYDLEKIIFVAVFSSSVIYDNNFEWNIYIEFQYDVVIFIGR